MMHHYLIYTRKYIIVYTKLYLINVHKCITCTYYICYSFNACSEKSAVLTFVLLYAHNVGNLGLVSVVKYSNRVFKIKYIYNIY